MAVISKLLEKDIGPYNIAGSTMCDNMYKILADNGYNEEKSIRGCFDCCAWQGHGNPVIMPWDRKICRFIAKECDKRRTVLSSGDGSPDINDIDEMLACAKDIEDCHT